MICYKISPFSLAVQNLQKNLDGSLSNLQAETPQPILLL